MRSAQAHTQLRQNMLMLIARGRERSVPGAVRTARSLFNKDAFLEVIREAIIVCGARTCVRVKIQRVRAAIPDLIVVNKCS